jgi:hypothetical protein
MLISHSLSRTFWPVLPWALDEGVADGVEFGQHGVQHLGGDVGIAAVAQQALLLAFELLQQVGLEVGAAGHFQHVEDRREGDVVLQRMFLMHKELEFLVQVLQPQQRANPLVERVFVDDQNDIPLGVGWREPRDSEP